MEVIYLLLFVSFFIAGIFLVAFFMAVKYGEFDDIKGGAVRILDSDSPTSNSKDPISKSL